MARLTRDRVAQEFPEVRQATNSKGEEEFVVHCPFFHKKGGRYKLYINEGGAYYCQDCCRSGDAFTDFFDSFTSKRYGHLQLVRDRATVPAGGTFHKPFVAKEGKDVVRWGGGKIYAPGRTTRLCDLPADHVARWYLEEERGLDPSEFADPGHPFAALYCHDGQIDMLGGQARTEGRIVYPVWMGGELVGWTARTIERRTGPETRETWDGRGWVERKMLPSGKWSDSHVPKWLHLPQMHTSQVLYNYDAARRFDYAVMCEGLFDAHKVGLQAIGYFGMYPSVVQRRLIKGRWRDVFWIPDRGVDRGSRNFKDALADLAEACRVRVLDLPEGRDDPGESPRSELREIIIGGAEQ